VHNKLESEATLGKYKILNVNTTSTPIVEDINGDWFLLPGIGILRHQEMWGEWPNVFPHILAANWEKKQGKVRQEPRSQW